MVVAALYNNDFDSGETGSLDTELKVHRIHGTRATILEDVPGSLVSLTRWAGGFFCVGLYKMFTSVLYFHS